MFQKYVFLVSCLLLSVSASHAQWCGTKGEELVARLLENKAALRESPVQFRSTRYVPIKFHLVGRNDGTGRARFRNVLEQLCVMNNDYAPLGIQFYIKDSFNIINNTILFEDHYNNMRLMEPYRDPNALNVWIVDAIRVNSNSDGESLGYYSVSRDWIVILRSEINNYSSSLSHEIGHFFGLLHTFYGWDYDPWEAGKHGNPAPELSPLGIPTERQDKANCDAAGDYICDTPPDYNLGFGWDDCNYVGGAKDPAGVLVNPDEMNFMGYFLRCSRTAYIFSTEQKNLMTADVASNKRAPLRNTYNPDYLQFSGVPQLESPASSVTMPVYDQVSLQWSAVEGATRYLVEVDALPTFTSAQVMTFVVTTNKLTVNILSPSETYYWRVRAFNEHYTCAVFSPRRSFRTGMTTATQEPTELNGWKIYSNPTTQGSNLLLAFNVQQSVKASIEVWNVMGQRVQSVKNYTFSSGERQLTLLTDQLKSGIYFISITTPTGRSVKKIIIQ